jgi:hypothetical protein
VNRSEKGEENKGDVRMFRLEREEGKEGDL